MGRGFHNSRLRLKCVGTRAETRFRLSAKRTSPFKSAGASVQSTTDIRGVRISGSNAGYTMFRGSVKVTGYPLHSPVSPSFPLPCVTVCYHILTGLRLNRQDRQSTRLYGIMCWGEVAVAPRIATAVFNLFFFVVIMNFCWYFIRSLKRVGVLHWKFITMFVFPNVRGSVLMEFAPLRVQQIHGDLYFSSRQRIR